MLVFLEYLFFSIEQILRATPLSTVWAHTTIYSIVFKNGASLPYCIHTCVLSISAVPGGRRGRRHGYDQS